MLKNYKIFLFFFGVLTGFFVFYMTSSFTYPSSIVSLFSPGSEQEVLDMINSARDEIQLEMYILSSDKVLDALVDAKLRGVNIRVILEKNVLSDENLNSYSTLQNAGIEVAWASENFKLTHSKFMIIDKRILLVGSHNFSRSALNFNREASVIIENNKVIEDFLSIFEHDWEIAYRTEINV